MTLSLTNAASLWDRTLPRPASLLSNGALDAYTRRSSSLLQHHIGSSDFVTPSVDESGRGVSVPCILMTSHSNFPSHSLSNGHGNANAEGEEDVNDAAVRARNSSVMSLDGPSSSSSPGSGSSAEAANGYCLCQPEPKIPRPRNAFILYRQHQHTGVVAQNPGLPNPDISKIIGEQWRQLPLKDKDEWKALAEQEKARHSQQFPDYRYRPRRNGRNSVHSSTSEGLPINTNNSGICAKCGGKTMNPPHTPHQPLFTPVTSAMPSMPARTQMAVPVSMPRTGQARYGYIPREHASYEHPVHYSIAPSAAHMESSEAKRRRLNSNVIYGTRNGYGEPSNLRIPPDASYVPRESVQRMQISKVSPMSPTRVPPIVNSQSSNFRSTETPSTPNHNRGTNMILPPLKTPVSVPKPNSLSHAQSQKSGVEAMIMSYPVLNKLKTLSSITPALASPGPTSPNYETRGAILAIEGMDEANVNSMTGSLVEQLKKDSRFAVKVFHGPNPYQALDSSRRASAGGKGEPMTTEKYLSIITEWHQLSQELVKYITTNPEGDQAQESHGSTVSRNASSQRPEKDDRRSIRSPISAVSPKTITQTAHLSLKTPEHKRSEFLQNESTVALPPNSRIPASAILEKQKALNHKLTQATTEGEQHAAASTSEPEPSSDLTTRRHSDSSWQNVRIPIAIVPHYQLTTVDACSLALSITDNYDPLSHWRWHATLWRGCVGADVAVVIKSVHEQYEEDMAAQGSNEAASSNITNQNQVNQRGPRHSMTQQNAPFGVEVRLKDYRAVVVKAVGGANDGKGLDQGRLENENWEKAKRRVVFEVEEYLRR